jgi:hypothetical protein
MMGNLQNLKSLILHPEMKAKRTSFKAPETIQGKTMA